VPFRPYWNNRDYLNVAGQGEDTLVSFYQKPEKILLIASNRRNEKRVLRIRLNTDQLGLSEPLTVRDVDSSFERPAGRDFRPATQERRQETEKLLKDEGDLLGGGGGDETAEEMLLGEDGMERKKRASMRPRMDGDVLTLPVRARDFRMVEVR
jgi:hypothetical protein